MSTSLANHVFVERLKEPSDEIKCCLVHVSQKDFFGRVDTIFICGFSPSHTCKPDEIITALTAHVDVSRLLISSASPVRRAFPLPGADRPKFSRSTSKACGLSVQTKLYVPSWSNFEKKSSYTISTGDRENITNKKKKKKKKKASHLIDVAVQTSGIRSHPLFSSQLDLITVQQRVDLPVGAGVGEKERERERGGGGVIMHGQAASSNEQRLKFCFETGFQSRLNSLLSGWPKLGI